MKMYQSDKSGMVLPQPCLMNILHLLRSAVAGRIYKLCANHHQIQVLTEPLCLAEAILNALPNNERGTKYRGLTYSASESVGLPIARGKLVCEFDLLA